MFDFWRISYPRICFAPSSSLYALIKNWSKIQKRQNVQTSSLVHITLSFFFLPLYNNPFYIFSLSLFKKKTRHQSLCDLNRKNCIFCNAPPTRPTHRRKSLHGRFAAQTPDNTKAYRHHFPGSTRWITAVSRSHFNRNLSQTTNTPDPIRIQAKREYVLYVCTIHAYDFLSGIYYMCVYVCVSALSSVIKERLRKGCNVCIGICVRVSNRCH